MPNTTIYTKCTVLLSDQRVQYDTSTGDTKRRPEWHSSQRGRRSASGSDGPRGCGDRWFPVRLAVSPYYRESTVTNFDSDEHEASTRLRLRLEALEKSSKRFMKHLSEDQKSSIAKSKNTTEAVLATINSASFEWCKRRESGAGAASTFKNKFHQACKTLDQHASLFTMLPKGNEYIAPFYGAFNTIVTVGLRRCTDTSNLC
jgi:hypothetical protein